MLVPHGPVYWAVILILCVGGLVIAWNGLTWDPSALFVKPDTSPRPRYIFTFGDSLTTTGYDVESSEYPSLWNPLGNPPFPGNTTSGGPNWVGFMIRDLAPEATMLYNFARYGATINDSLVPPLTPHGHDLRYQVSQFSEYLGPKRDFAPWRKDNSAFVLWMGINDVTVTHALNSVGLGDSDTTTDKILFSYLRLLDALQVAGGRNFIVLTVPQVNRNPKFLQVDPAAAEQVLEAIRIFNEKLRKRVDLWLSKHGKSTVRFLDTHPIFKKVLDHPKLYKATDATCMDSKGAKCLWADYFHPGQAIQNAIAHQVYASLDDMSFWGPPLPTVRT